MTRLDAARALTELVAENPNERVLEERRGAWLLWAAEDLTEIQGCGPDVDGHGNASEATEQGSAG